MINVDPICSYSADEQDGELLVTCMRLDNGAVGHQTASVLASASDIEQAAWFACDRVLTDEECAAWWAVQP